MVKKKKIKLSLFVGISLALLLMGIFLLINFTRKKLRQENENSIYETGISEGSVSVFPSDFPIYEGANVETSYSTEGEGSQATSVVWSTDAQISEVYSFYKDELASTGWEMITRSEEESSIAFTVEKDNLFGIIGIGKGEEEKTIISVTIGMSN